MTMTMELCTLRLVSNLLPIRSAPRHIQSLFPCTTSPSPLLLKHTRFASGLRQCVNSPPGGTSTETKSVETAKIKSFFDDDEPVTDGVITTTSEETSTETKPYESAEAKKDKSEPEKKEDTTATVETTSPEAKKEVSVTQLSESPQESPLADLDLSKFLEDLGLKVDFEENKYQIIALGGGGLIALWLSFAVIGAIDSIPLFPKLLELVGLGYTIWFSIRYLIFKESREKLVAKVEELKQEVFG